MSLLVLVFAGLLLLSVPIAFVVGLSSLAQLLALGLPLQLIPLQMVDGVNSVTLLTIPLFVMTGEIMSHSGLMDAVVEFADLLVGRFRGGLAHVNVLGSTFFAGMAGSAVADISGLGSLEIDMMSKAGYKRSYAAALTASSSIQSPIIPPSILTVMYAAAVSGVSTGGLFAGGFIPGFTIALANMVIVAMKAKRENHPCRETKIPFKDAVGITLNSIPAMLVPIIILGGIFGGVFTTTEASGIAVLYALILTLFIYKTLKFSDLPALFLKCAKTSTIVLFIIAGAQVLGYIFAVMRVPTMITNFLVSFTTNKWVAITLVNVLLLIIGTFMDAGTSIILFCPIFAPVLISFGFHPIHAALVMVVAICVGLITPPVGVALFTASAVSGVKLEEVIKECVPFIIVSVVALLIITYIPELVLFVPRLLGYA
ncbi:MAG: TRAP transporter large permease [Firmicutes bacterium]|jgi:tripartite ATP-independent transporter DctM subunit|nr:TRAP transporter large permease [Bacillota bacterium]